MENKKDDTSMQWMLYGRSDDLMKNDWGRIRKTTPSRILKKEWKMERGRCSKNSRGSRGVRGGERASSFKGQIMRGRIYGLYTKCHFGKVPELEGGDHFLPKSWFVGPLPPSLC